jgi:hypothetical protein
MYSPPRTKAARPAKGGPKTIDHNNNFNQHLNRNHSKGKLNPVSHALPPELWSALRWEEESVGGDQ